MKSFFSIRLLVTAIFCMACFVAACSDEGTRVKPEKTSEQVYEQTVEQDAGKMSQGAASRSAADQANKAANEAGEKGSQEQEGGEEEVQY